MFRKGDWLMQRPTGSLTSVMVNEVSVARVEQAMEAVVGEVKEVKEVQTIWSFGGL